MSLAWGGYQNGLIPQSVLVAVGKDSFGVVQYLEAGAAKAYFALDAAFYRQFHKHLTVNYGNRTLAQQKEMYAAYLAHPATNPLAAYPGTSNHGWARACDFGSDTQYAGTPEANWLKAHGPEYGFWPTGYGFQRVEPWHYDWRPGTATASLDLILIPEQREDDEMRVYQISDGGLQGTIWGLAPGAMFNAKDGPDGLLMASALNPDGKLIPKTEKELRAIAGYLGIPGNLIDASSTGVNWSWAKDAVTLAKSSASASSGLTSAQVEQVVQASESRIVSAIPKTFTAQ